MSAGEDVVSFRRSEGLHGSARVPGDKSISHRGLLLAALAEGTSRVSGLSDGDDVARTAVAIEALGAERVGDTIKGGRSRLAEPRHPIDVGNSGTAIRLLSGLLAGLPFFSVLVGDDSVHRRPMDRIVEPLRQMGARIDGRSDGRLAPLAIRGGALAGVRHDPKVASAQVKGAILFAGLSASGETTVGEPVATRRHTEELFRLSGIEVNEQESRGRHLVSVRAGTPAPFELEVPGDPSQAAFLVVAGCLVGASELTVRNVYVGPGRDGFLRVLERMGAALDVEMVGPFTADLHVSASALHGTAIGGSEIADLIDEVPVLMIAAAFAEGETTVSDAAELRVKESDRIESVAAGLRALGVLVETAPDGLVVQGGRPHGGIVDASGDHRVAMAFAIAGLAGEEVTVRGFSSVQTSWPGFVDALGSLR